jgi:hypothetical protein
VEIQTINSRKMGSSCAVVGTRQSVEFHWMNPKPIIKCSLLSAQTAKLRSSWRYNWLSLIHCSLFTRSEEDGTNGGRTDIIRWARFSSGLNTEAPAVTKQTTRLVSVIYLQTVKQQVIIYKPAGGRWSASRSGHGTTRKYHRHPPKQGWWPPELV